MQQDKTGKKGRMLGIYTKLMQGAIVNKAEEACRYGVTEKSIERDFDEIRAFLADDGQNCGIYNDIVYDRAKNGYCLQRMYQPKLTNSEILAVCKILLDSRALTKKEMDALLKKLMDCCVPQIDKKLVDEMIRNEASHYVEPRHKTVFLNKMWELALAIQQNKYIQVRYQRLKGKECKKRRLKPVAIMFSEFYFYLTAFIDDAETRKHFEVADDCFPTIYRIDRIQELKVLEEHFQVPYKERFEEGEFRKRVQFMYGGKLKRVKFRYTGPSLEAVLDRLPTAEVVCEDADGWTVRAEVFGKGIEMWFRSQGDAVTVLERK